MNVEFGVYSCEALDAPIRCTFDLIVAPSDLHSKRAKGISVSENDHLRLAVNLVHERVAEAAGFTAARRELTDIWRDAAVRLVFDSWRTNPPPDGEAALAEWKRAQRLRLSTRRLMRLRLALEEVGVHCEPSLERLSDDTDTARIYRTWRDPERAA